MKRLLFFSLLLIVACSNKPKPQQKNPSEDSLNLKNLTMVVWSLPFKHKDIIVAQGILETGWFKSKNCVNNNNVFGMRKCYSRATTSDTAINGYAHYPNWQQSVIDYYLLQSTTQSINPTKTRQEYYRYLDRIYSEVGSGYSSQLKDIIKQYDLDNDDPKPYVKPKVPYKNRHKKKIIKKKR
jgi:uncharacterized FlgJ-related protein